MASCSPGFQSQVQYYESMGAEMSLAWFYDLVKGRSHSLEKFRKQEDLRQQNKKDTGLVWVSCAEL